MSCALFNLYFAIWIIHSTKYSHTGGSSVDLSENTSNGNSLNPSQLQLKLQMDSEQISLNLQKNSNSNNMALVILGSNGVLSPWNDQRTGDYAVYQDPNRLASILVLPQRSNDGGILRDYQGIFEHKDEYYYLSRDKTSKRRRRSNDGQYVVTKVDPPPTNYAPQKMSNIKLPYSGELLSYAGNTTSNYTVESLVVLDYSIYKRWFDLSKKTTDEAKKQDAIFGIRYYYAQVMNGVDLRYNSIKQNDFNIRVRLAGFYIATTQQDSVWTEKSDIRQEYNGQVYSDAYKALQTLTDWIGETAKDLPQFDQATLFTNNILTTGNTGASSVSISGIAEIQGICGRGRVSLNKEGGEYSSTETAAHEMGHNLGAQHDGTSNPCDGRQQFIMSSAPGQLTTSNFLNPYTFSTCSIDYFRNYLRTLTLMNSNCLLDTSSNVDPSQVEQASKMPPGQFINTDQQCQHLYGPKSFYCGGNINDQQMCKQMWCYDPSPDVNRCVTKGELRAANGTTCGNRRWCIMGTCTQSDSAPVASDYCLSGDYRGDAVDCKSKIGNNPGFCYQTYYNDTCCASCQAIRKRNTDSCPYGDTDPNYCRSAVKGQACYDQQIQKSCCATCRTFQTNVADLSSDCTYGDKAEWCATSDNSVCYTSLSTCCLTCYYRKIGYTDCPYGDRASWCYNLPKSQCADSSTANTCCLSCDPKKTTPKPRPRPTTLPPTGGGNTGPFDPNCIDTASWCSNMPSSYCYSTSKMCCQTCKSYYKPRSGCEYGNRFSWCSTIARSDCKYLEYVSDCCDQCSGSVNGPFAFCSVLLQFGSALFIFLYFFVISV